MFLFRMNINYNNSTFIILFGVVNLIYIIKKKYIMKTKKKVSIALNRELDEILNEEFNNKSKYIEYLIYQDLLKNSKNDKINKIIL